MNEWVNEWMNWMNFLFGYLFKGTEQNKTKKMKGTKTQSDGN